MRTPFPLIVLNGRDDMKKKTLRKDFFMEIKRSLGRFLSIFFIVAIGVAFFSGIRSSEPDMRLSGDAYFDGQNLMDIKVLSTLGLTKKDVQEVQKLKEIDKVEGGYSVDALCQVYDSKKVVHIFSMLPTLNVVNVEEGRMPSKPGECLVDAEFMKNSGYRIGDEITFSSGTSEAITNTLKRQTYTIVGSASSPSYISYGRGSSLIGTGNVSGFVCVPEEEFALDIYTELYATVKGAKEETAFTDAYNTRIKQAEKSIEKIKTEREKERYEAVVTEAQSELQKAKEEFERGKQEAQKQIDDASAKLDSGKSELENAKSLIASGYQEIDAGSSSLDTQETELNRQYMEVIARSAQVEEKENQLAQAKELWALFEESDQIDESIKVEVRNKIAEAQAQLDDARSQLDAAKAQLDYGQQQIAQGRDQARQAEKNLEKAEQSIPSKEQELNSAQKQFEESKKEAEEKILEGERKIQDAEEEIRKIEHAKWYIQNREALPDYKGYGENADRMKAIGKVFPVLFFLVAALISLTTMTRMVEEQRIQIGTLKALGYSKASIAMKYVGYAFLATIGGSLVGILIGEKILPYIIIVSYGIMYQHMHVVLTPYNFYFGFVAAFMALGCTLLATIFSCYKEMKQQPAELMRPPAPKQGKRVFMEKIPFLWKRLSFIWKATVRNLIRYKKRFFMTIIGIGGCMALLLVGFGLRDSIVDIANLQFSKIQMFDATVILNKDASVQDKESTYETLKKDQRVEDATFGLLQNMEVINGDAKKDVYMTVPNDREAFSRFVSFQDRKSKETYQLDDNGIILTEKMANMLGVKKGEYIQIRDDVRGEISLKISEICENYVGHFLYMSPTLYEKMYGKSPEYNAIYYTMREEDKEQLEVVGEGVMQTKGALSINYVEELEATLDKMLGSLNVVLVVLVVSAGMLAFVVLYNLNNINITERQRELATLKVLGFYNNEVSSYVYRENMILSILGALLGMILGQLLHKFVIVTVEVETAMFGRNINFSSFVYSFFITIGFSLLVNGVMYFKLKKIDMVESLKSVE